MIRQSRASGSLPWTAVKIPNSMFIKNKKTESKFRETKHFDYKRGNVTLVFDLIKNSGEIDDFMELLKLALEDCKKFKEEL